MVSCGPVRRRGRSTNAVGNAGAERARSASGQIRPGPAVLVGDVGDEGHLGHVLDDHPVVGHHRPDGPQVAELGLQAADPFEVPGSQLGELGGAIVPAAVVPAEGVHEQPACLGGVAVDAERACAVTVQLSGVDVDLDDLLSLAHAPLDVRELHAGADAHYHVGGQPEFAAHGQVGVQAVARVEHPEPHVAGEHRRLQRLGQLPHRLGGVLGASAHHDKRTTGLPQDSGGLLDPFGVNGWLGGSGRFEDAVGRLAPHVDRHLHGNRAGDARHQIVDRLLPHADGIDAALDVAGVLGQLAQHGGGVGQIVQDAGAAAAPW